MNDQTHPEDPRPHVSGRTMHDRLEDPYCDPICCCEAEPRWQRLAEELEEVANVAAAAASGVPRSDQGLSTRVS